MGAVERGEPVVKRVAPVRYGMVRGFSTFVVERAWFGITAPLAGWGGDSRQCRAVSGGHLAGSYGVKGRARRGDNTLAGNMRGGAFFGRILTPFPVPAPAAFVRITG